MKHLRQHALFLVVLATLLTFIGFVLAADAEPPIEIIYFKPSDIKTPSQDEIDSFRDLMIEIQSFFASEMDRYGFGQKTFAFNPNIRVVEGRLKAERYSDVDTVKNEIHQIDFEVQNKIDIVFLAGRQRILGGALGAILPLCWTWPGQPQDVNDCNYFGVIPTGYKEFLLPVTAHEIGHAFGLHHTPNMTVSGLTDIMFEQPIFYEGVKEELKNYAFSLKDATFLDRGSRLSVQQTIQQDPQGSNQEIVIDTDVNDDGYTDLYDCLIVRSGMSAETNYDTDINNDGVTNILDLMLVKAAAFEAIAAAAPSKRKVKITSWASQKLR